MKHWQARLGAVGQAAAGAAARAVIGRGQAWASIGNGGRPVRAGVAQLGGTPVSAQRALAGEGTARDGEGTASDVGWRRVKRWEVCGGQRNRHRPGGPCPGSRRGGERRRCPSASVLAIFIPSAPRAQARLRCSCPPLLFLCCPARPSATPVLHQPLLCPGCAHPSTPSVADCPKTLPRSYNLPAPSTTTRP